MSWFSYLSDQRFMRALPPGAGMPHVVAGSAWNGTTTNRPDARFRWRTVRQAITMLCGGFHLHFDISPLGDACFTQIGIRSPHDRETCDQELHRGGPIFTSRELRGFRSPSQMKPVRWPPSASAWPPTTHRPSTRHSTSTALIDHAETTGHAAATSLWTCVWTSLCDRLAWDKHPAAAA